MTEYRHIFSVHRDKVQYYWQSLAMHDTLKYRLSVFPDPSWDDVLSVIRENGEHMYMAMKGDSPVAEFSLDGFTGKAAQIHFSTHPDQSWKDTIKQGKEVCNLLMDTWKDEHGKPFLQSLYANIAVSNRASCITALRMGFKKIGTLKGGMFIARHNRYEDGTLLVRTL